MRSHVGKTERITPNLQHPNKLMRVLYLTNIHNPYRDEFFSQFGRICDLTVIFEQRDDKHRDNSWFENAVVDSYEEVFVSSDSYIAAVRETVSIINEGWDRIIIGCYNSFVQVAAMQYMRMRNISYIVNLDGPLYHGVDKFKRMIRDSLLQGASAYIVAGKKSAESVREISGTRPVITYPFGSLNQATLTELRARQSERIPNQVLCVGQFERYKGIDILVDAAEALPFLNFTIVGVGRRSDELNDLLIAKGIGNVEVISFLPFNELVERYLKARVLVLPSRQECWGLVVNEAAACGTPIVSTWGSGAAVDFLGEEYPQFLAEPDNVESLIQVICTAICQSGEDLMRYSSWLKQRAGSYSIEEMVLAHTALLEMNKLDCRKPSVTENEIRKSKKRIGILTFHHVYNYGATLQAYALARVVGETAADDEVVILNYQNESLSNAAKLKKQGESISPAIIAKVLFRIAKHHSFDAFDREFLTVTNPIANTEAFALEAARCDALIVGSDQVWNDDITGGDKVFYLSIPNSCHATIYSYAASFAGSPQRAINVLERHSDELSGFTAVSLREPGGIDEFEDALRCEVRQDVDPVLLIPGDQWLELASKRLCRKPYLFMYLVGEEVYIRRFAESYASAHGLIIIDNKRSVEFLKHCGPRDFLSWIAHASLVVTNSFHGTAFSVLFNKDSFYELGQNEKRNNRAAGLLNTLGIKDREILGAAAPDNYMPIEWGKVNEQLEFTRINSLNYIQRIVGETQSAISPPFPKCFVGVHQNDAIYNHSSSGGAFTALTDAAFARDPNTVIYGCAWDGTRNVRHIRALTKQERDLMRGSKYIESEIRDSFHEVVADLSNGKQVIFSGTPCQIAALNSYVKRKDVPSNRLITISFVCHGVAVNQFFQDYINGLEKRYKGTATHVNFRAKGKPGKIQNMEVRFDNGRIYRAASIRSDWFYSVYQANLVMKPACYRCKYNRDNRPSDIDIADAWGVEWIDGKAPSLIMANNEKGLDLIALSSPIMNLEEMPLKRIVQEQMLHCTKRPKYYDEFWQKYNEDGYAAAQKWFGNNTLTARIKSGVIAAGDSLGVQKFLRRVHG